MSWNKRTRRRYIRDRSGQISIASSALFSHIMRAIPCQADMHSNLLHHPEIAELYVPET